MSQTFDQQVALITGGSTGIGAASAHKLARGGARVVITGRHEDTLRSAAAAHTAISYVVADVASASDVARVIDTVKALHQRLDILVNNAGIAEMAPLADSAQDHVRRIFEVNFYGLIETTRLALPLLRQARGSVVNVASIVADQPFANMGVYSASKAAVLALTRAWAQELAAEGVRVNAVSPGPIETPLFSPEKMKLSEKHLQELGAAVLSLVPARRFGKPDEVAEVIAFLASRAASYVTGGQYSVGGGIEA